MPQWCWDRAGRGVSRPTSADRSRTENCASSEHSPRPQQARRRSCSFVNLEALGRKATDASSRQHSAARRRYDERQARQRNSRKSEESFVLSLPKALDFCDATSYAKFRQVAESAASTHGESGAGGPEGGPKALKVFLKPNPHLEQAPCSAQRLQELEDEQMPAAHDELQRRRLNLAVSCSTLAASDSQEGSKEGEQLSNSESTHGADAPTAPEGPVQAQVDSGVHHEASPRVEESADDEESVLEGFQAGVESVDGDSDLAINSVHREVTAQHGAQLHDADSSGMRMADDLQTADCDSWATTASDDDACLVSQTAPDSLCRAPFACVLSTEDTSKKVSEMQSSEEKDEEADKEEVSAMCFLEDVGATSCTADDASNQPVQNCQTSPCEAVQEMTEADSTSNIFCERVAHARDSADASDDDVAMQGEEGMEKRMQDPQSDTSDGDDYMSDQHSPPLQDYSGSQGRPNGGDDNSSTPDESEEELSTEEILCAEASASPACEDSPADFEATAGPLREEFLGAVAQASSSGLQGLCEGPGPQDLDADAVDVKLNDLRMEEPGTASRTSTAAARDPKIGEDEVGESSDDVSCADETVDCQTTCAVEEPEPSCPAGEHFIGSVGNSPTIHTLKPGPAVLEAEALLASLKINDEVSVVAEVAEHRQERSEAGNAAERWIVEVERVPGSRLGMVIGKVRLEVQSVGSDGLIARWNAENPSKAVKKGDAVLSVNGKFLTSEILAECKECKRLCITVSRSNIGRDAANSDDTAAKIHQPLPSVSLPEEPVTPTQSRMERRISVAFGEREGGAATPREPTTPTLKRNSSFVKAMELAKQALEASSEVDSTCDRAKDAMPVRRIKSGLADSTFEQPRFLANWAPSWPMPSSNASSGDYGRSFKDTEVANYGQSANDGLEAFLAGRRRSPKSSRNSTPQASAKSSPRVPTPPPPPVQTAKSPRSLEVASQVHVLASSSEEELPDSRMRIQEELEYLGKSRSPLLASHNADGEALSFCNSLQSAPHELLSQRRASFAEEQRKHDRRGSMHSVLSSGSGLGSVASVIGAKARSELDTTAPNSARGSCSGSVKSSASSASCSDESSSEGSEEPEEEIPEGETFVA
eukprot:TRINITY_DN74514_c0_g1_i1.p1 TRINITY_DN74514_c0_g1~~TRINITY_DN74514_c0_g1_i1.p1  ORF type:complete len:1109 (+),score=219.43 TRINITY_DN74514_c0_g1_i1:79-3405(+)